MARREAVWESMWGLTPAENLWNTYKDPFGYADMNKSIRAADEFLKTLQ